MDKNLKNVSGNMSDDKKETKKDHRRISIMESLNDQGKEGAKKALEERIPQKSIDSFRETLKDTPDDMIGEKLDALTESILNFIDENPSEYVLIKLLWIITSLASPKSLFAFGKSLQTVGALRAIMDDED